ncbi:MAG: hypothetical protein AB8A39_02335, partial [Prochlorococcus sp.]
PVTGLLPVLTDEAVEGHQSDRCNRSTGLEPARTIWLALARLLVALLASNGARLPHCLFSEASE